MFKQEVNHSLRLLFPIGMKSRDGVIYLTNKSIEEFSFVSESILFDNVHFNY